MGRFSKDARPSCSRIAPKSPVKAVGSGSAELSQPRAADTIAPRRFNSHGTSYALCVTLGLGNLSEISLGGRKVKAIATAPRPMPNEAM
jgi:hypothetical protein